MLSENVEKIFRRIEAALKSNFLCRKIGVGKHIAGVAKSHAVYIVVVACAEVFAENNIDTSTDLDINLSNTEVLKDEKISLILTSKVNNGFAIKSKRYTIGSLKQGIKERIELKNPIKLKTPIKGTTATFANKLKGVKLLK